MDCIRNLPGREGKSNTLERKRAKMKKKAGKVIAVGVAAAAVADHGFYIVQDLLALADSSDKNHLLSSCAAQRYS